MSGLVYKCAQVQGPSTTFEGKQQEARQKTHLYNEEASPSSPTSRCTKCTCAKSAATAPSSVATEYALGGSASTMACQYPSPKPMAAARHRSRKALRRARTWARRHYKTKVSGQALRSAASACRPKPATAHEMSPFETPSAYANQPDAWKAPLPPITIDPTPIAT